MQDDSGLVECLEQELRVLDVNQAQEIPTKCTGVHAYYPAPQLCLPQRNLFERVMYL